MYLICFSPHPSFVLFATTSILCKWYLLVFKFPAHFIGIDSMICGCITSTCVVSTLGSKRIFFCSMYLDLDVAAQFLYSNGFNSVILADIERCMRQYWSWDILRFDTYTLPPDGSWSCSSYLCGHPGISEIAMTQRLPIRVFEFVPSFSSISDLIRVTILSAL